MKEHEKSFCRARVAFEENRKLKGDEQEESNSGEHSPVSVSPPPSSTQEAVSTFAITTTARIVPILTDIEFEPAIFKIAIFDRAVLTDHFQLAILISHL